MKKIFFAAFLLVCFSGFGQNRFPSIDSLQNYISRYIRNSTMEAFTNYRLNNVVYGTTEFLDSTFAYSGVDSIWIVDGGTDADTLRYRRWGVVKTAGLITGGGGGSVAWGGITGTLSNQTDLQNALNLKLNITTAAATYVPYTGANESVNLGAFGLTTDRFVFNQTPTLAGGERIMRWNDTDGTLDVGLKGGNVTLQVGQEQHNRARNNTGSTILNGQVVYISGSTGTNTTVALARADASSTSKATIGIATEDISNGQSGFVTTFGKVRDINTSSLTEGGLVYLSSTTAGGFTSTAPTGDTYPIVIGVCERSHATQGVIFVHIDKEYVRQYELDTAKANIRAEKLSNITGLVTAGAGISVTGSGTSGSPYVVANTGGTNVDSTAARIRRGTYAQRPASPDTGAIYEQTNRLAGTWKYNGSAWQFLGEQSQFSFNSNLSGPNPFPGIVGGAAAGASTMGDIGRGSYLRLTTGTTSSGQASYGFNEQTDLTLVVDSMIRWDEWLVRVPTLSDATDEFQVSFGYNGHQSLWNSSTCIFRYSHNINGGSWQTQTLKPTVGTTYKNTGVPVVAGTWYRLAIEIDGYAQAMRFYIDDQLVTTHSVANGDNVPFPNSTATEPYNFAIAKFAGTTARTVDVDYYFRYFVKKKYR